MLFEPRCAASPGKRFFSWKMEIKGLPFPSFERYRKRPGIPIRNSEILETEKVAFFSNKRTVFPEPSRR